jgi:hypothetical protein
MAERDSELGCQRTLTNPTDLTELTERDDLTGGWVIGSNSDQGRGAAQSPLIMILERVRAAL